MSRTLALVLAALTIRAAVSLHGHSGEGLPPMFGDYEAQRHWMEITRHLPPSEWYWNSTRNDLLYWGLDYPPLTALHSWGLGHLAHWYHEPMVALTASRGHESVRAKVFMRLSALVSDACVFFPGAWALSRAIGRQADPVATCRNAPLVGTAVLAGLLLQPTVILVDHGHMQYNCVALGLIALAFAAWARGHDVQGAVLFSLALNFKQIALYHALAVFAWLVGRAWRRDSWVGTLAHVARLGAAVLVTFALVWAPFLSPRDGFADARQVLHRLFPFARGVFEDKVASFWCAAEPGLKLKATMPLERLRIVSTVATLVASVPGMAALVRARSLRALLAGTASVSLGFFLFAFQVHEKSILFAALPVAALARWRPRLCAWFGAVALFSLFPLMRKDSLELAYSASVLGSSLMATAHVRLFGAAEPWNSWATLACFASLVGMGALHLIEASQAPPAALPHLWPYLFALFSCCHFAFFWLVFAVDAATATSDGAAEPVRSKVD